MTSSADKKENMSHSVVQKSSYISEKVRVVQNPLSCIATHIQLQSCLNFKIVFFSKEAIFAILCLRFWNMYQILFRHLKKQGIGTPT
mmetsp:Transcript_4923/g.7369  ORF Transcript_4923/g.7369 Transcript_4923/m.7369 type:complete len:87 (+) Transcript_4923:318-578(+)